jgi:hypothetical protein
VRFYAPDWLFPLYFVIVPLAAGWTKVMKQKIT